MRGARIEIRWSLDRILASLWDDYGRGPLKEDIDQVVRNKDRRLGGSDGKDGRDSRPNNGMLEDVRFFSSIESCIYV